MKANEMKEIKQGHPVYFFYGTESFLIENALSGIREKMGCDGNVVTYDLEETPVQTLVEEAETTSLFGEARLIVGRNATFVTTAKGKGTVHHDWTSLISYLENPLATNRVVLIVNTDSLDKRKKITKALEQHACAIQFHPLKGKELSTWLIHHLKQWNATINEEAAHRLIELVGNSLWLLHHECEKLSTYVGQAGVITLPMVEELVPRTLEQDVFKLTDYLMNQRVNEALQLWQDLLTLSQEPLRILALITRQLRLTLQVKVLAEEHHSEKEISSFLKVHPYPVKLARNQGFHFSEKVLRHYLFLAVQAEEQIKTGLVDKQIAVERILLHMCDESAKIC